jgi:uncharacterized protein (TIGR03437 family)
MRGWPALMFALCFLPMRAPAQPNRIARGIDNSRRTLLAGNRSPKARPEYDQGPVSPSLEIPRVTLALAQSAEQAAALDQLLAEQQTPGSPNYHKWLTPEEFAQRFGVNQADLNQITAWLGAQGLTVTGVATGRNWVTVSGPASRIQQAFQTELHRYVVDGETHFANATEPSVPTALAGVVMSIHGLNDFRMRPANRGPRAGGQAGVGARYTSSKGNHYLAPDDLATIYNIKALYNRGIDGSGQRLVVAGQTKIDLADIRQFRTMYNLPANDPQVMLIPGATDPGIVSGDLAEADLDLEWSGAVARNATIIYVYGSDVMQSVQYAIDQNLAPVVTTSYGLCELEMSTGETASLRSWAKQGNALGITWFAASGDAGGADCNDARNPGPAVDVPASIPEVTGVGGTEFAEAGAVYWNDQNDGNRASALSYIPETAWNDSAADGEPAAGGGGPSTLYARPSWQVGAGVPNDGARHVPDVAMAASADHDGYLVYTSGALQVYGGTSVPSPAFAGFAALLNQHLVSAGVQASAGLGNMNPALYALAQARPDVFHDITTGDNIVTVVCPPRRTCSASPVGSKAGPGYDEATGLGSIDAYPFAVAWAGGKEPSGARPSAAPTIFGLTNAASYEQAFAPGMIVSAFGSGLAPSTQAAAAVPLPPAMAGVSVTVNGVAAPLYYVSPTQLNIQVPYETPAGAAVLTVDNNGQSASQTFSVAAAAPGIFTDTGGTAVPHGSAARGQVITLFITGAGAVSPAVATGAAPPDSATVDQLPAPLLHTTVTVGGVAAPIWFVGIPWGLAGVVQINYQVPAASPLGTQQVVVKVGNVSSAPAKLVVN